jgi:hypothetical protein
MREDSEKNEYWRQHVQALQECGLSRRAYCEQHQIKLSQLGYWSRKFIPTAKPNGSGHKAAWIPLQVSEDGLTGIDLRIGRITIAVKPGFDPSLLADILRTLNAIC